MTTGWFQSLARRQWDLTGRASPTSDNTFIGREHGYLFQSLQLVMVLPGDGEHSVLDKLVWFRYHVLCIHSGLAENYARIAQYMYGDSTTAVRCAEGVTAGFEVKVALHQGSALSPCLFAMVMDRMMDDIREEATWTMMFTDDNVICSESRDKVEEKVDSWRYALERRGMKVNRRKTECMCVNERQVNVTVKMQIGEVAKEEDFKYMDLTVQSNEECGREVRKRVPAGWNGWRTM